MILLVSFYFTSVVLKHIFASKKVGHAQTKSSWGKEIEFQVKTIDAISYHLILELQRYNPIKVHI